MKSVKITKKMLNDPAYLLEKCGAVNGGYAYPSRVYMNDSDYQILAKNLKKQYKKEKPYLSKKHIDLSAGVTLLNLGPVNLKKGIQKGFLLVDDHGIQKDKNEDSVS